LRPRLLRAALVSARFGRRRQRADRPHPRDQPAVLHNWCPISIRRSRRSSTRRSRRSRQTLCRLEMQRDQNASAAASRRRNGGRRSRARAERFCSGPNRSRSRSLTGGSGEQCVGDGRRSRRYRPTDQILLLVPNQPDALELKARARIASAPGSSKRRSARGGAARARRDHLRGQVLDRPEIDTCRRSSAFTDELSGARRFAAWRCSSATRGAS
jgi:hypothetical protein